MMPVKKSQMWLSGQIVCMNQGSGGESLVRGHNISVQQHCLFIERSGYGISPWLVTQFKTPGNYVEHRLNLIHTREKCAIERTFGQLKRRFSILSNCIRFSLDRVLKIVVSCTVLHNIGKQI